MAPRTKSRTPTRKPASKGRGAPSQAPVRGRPTLSSGVARTHRVQAMVTPEINADVERLRGARSRSAWAADVVAWAVEHLRDDPDLAARFALGRDVDE